MKLSSVQQVRRGGRLSELPYPARQARAESRRMVGADLPNGCTHERAIRELASAGLQEGA